MGLDQTEFTGTEKEAAPDFPYSAIVVCGSGFSGATHGLGPLGLERVYASYHAYKLGLAPKIVLTGGQKWSKPDMRYVEEEDLTPPEYKDIPSEATQLEREEIEKQNRQERRSHQKSLNETTPNSVLMRKVLVDKLKVPEEDILCDELSITTTDNFSEALNVLGENNIPKNNLLVISDGFHIERIMAESKRFGVNFVPMATETSLLLRSLDMAGKIKETDQEHQAETHISDQEIEDHYEQVVSRWREIYEKKWVAKDSVKAEKIADDVRGLPETEKVWSVWGPHMLTLNDPQMLEKILNLGQSPEHLEMYLEWKKEFCKLTGLPLDISNQELNNLIINRVIHPTYIRVSRLITQNDDMIESSAKLAKEIINNPELRKQYVDISSIILSLYHQPSQLEKFLHSPYTKEIDEWRIRHEINLGSFDSYESFCSALLRTEVEPDKIARSREKMVDPDRRKSELKN